MKRPPDSAIDACVDVALDLAAHAVESMTPLVRQATYQVLNSLGCTMQGVTDARSRLRVLACTQLEQNARCP